MKNCIRKKDSTEETWKKLLKSLLILIHMSVWLIQVKKGCRDIYFLNELRIIFCCFLLGRNGFIFALFSFLTQVHRLKLDTSSLLICYLVLSYSRLSQMSHILKNWKMFEKWKASCKVNLSLRLKTR